MIRPLFMVGIHPEGENVVLTFNLHMTRAQWKNLIASAEPGSGYTRDFTPPNGEPPASAG